jgi:hypothetical protein
MSVPSIKGSVFEGLMADLRETVAAGRGDLDELREALEDKHRDLLEGDVASIQWVPIGAYAAILDYLTRVEGAADPVAYLRRRGANACDRLIGGIYKAFKVEPGNWGARTGEIMMGMGKLLYNFTRWSFSDLGSGVYQISCEEASDFPDCAMETAHGFIERYASKASGRAVKVESSRATRARIVFTVRARD